MNNAAILPLPDCPSQKERNVLVGEIGELEMLSIVSRHLESLFPDKFTVSTSFDPKFDSKNEVNKKGGVDILAWSITHKTTGEKILLEDIDCNNLENIKAEILILEVKSTASTCKYPICSTVADIRYAMERLLKNSFLQRQGGIIYLEGVLRQHKKVNFGGFTHQKRVNYLLALIRDYRLYHSEDIIFTPLINQIGINPRTLNERSGVSQLYIPWLSKAELESYRKVLKENDKLMETGISPTTLLDISPSHQSSPKSVEELLMESGHQGEKDIPVFIEVEN